MWFKFYSGHHRVAGLRSTCVDHMMRRPSALARGHPVSDQPPEERRQAKDSPVRSPSAGAPPTVSEQRPEPSSDAHPDSDRQGSNQPSASHRLSRLWKWFTGSPSRKALSAAGAILLAAISGITGAAASGWFASSTLNSNTTPENSNVSTSGTGPDLSAQVTQGWAGDCGGGGNGWVFPKSASAAIAASPATGPTRDGQTWVSDPGAWGAVEASDVQVQLVVSGNSQNAIVLTDITVHILRRRPALQGAIVNIVPYPPVACASLTFQAGTIDLDTSPPTWIPGTLPPGVAANDRRAPVKFPYVVSAADPEPFILTVTTQHCDCTWTMELDWIQGSTNGHSMITDNGKPFETTAAADLPSIEWKYGPNNGPWQMVG